MEDLSLVISNITHKTRKLIKNYELQKEEISILKTKNKDLQQILEINKIKIHELEKKISVLSIKNTFVTGETKMEVRRNISKMLKEIDDCIQNLSQ